MENDGLVNIYKIYYTIKVRKLMMSWDCLQTTPFHLKTAINII